MRLVIEVVANIIPYTWQCGLYPFQQYTAEAVYSQISTYMTCRAIILFLIAADPEHHHADD